MTDTKKTYHAYDSAIMAGLTGMFSGYIASNISYAIATNPKLENATIVKATMTASILLGAIISCSFSGKLANKIGRVNLIKYATLVGICSNISLLASTYCYYSAVVSRFMMGLTFGIYNTISPLYVQEATKGDKNADSFKVVYQLGITFSICLTTLCTFISDFREGWKVIFSISLGILILICIFCVFWAKESDEFKNLKKTDNQTIEYYKSEDESEKKSGVLKLYALSIILAFTQQLSGINAVIYYINEITKKFDEPSYSFLASFAVMFFNFLATLIFILVNKKFKRKNIFLLITVAGMIFGMSFTWLFRVFDIGIFGEILSIVSCCLFIFSFAMGIGPLYFIIINEIFPKRSKGRGSSFSNAFQNLFNLFTTISFPIFKGFIKDHVFLIYMISLILSFGLLLCFFREINYIDGEEDNQYKVDVEGEYIDSKVSQTKNLYNMAY